MLANTRSMITLGLADPPSSTSAWSIGRVNRSFGNNSFDGARRCTVPRAVNLLATLKAPFPSWSTPLRWVSVDPNKTRLNTLLASSTSGSANRCSSPKTSSSTSISIIAMLCAECIYS